MSENRAILLTAPGAGAIAVVRIMGSAVGEFLGKHFSKTAKVGRCVHGELRDREGQVLDDIVVVLIGDGATADLNLHGGPWVVESVMELLKSEGFGAPEAFDAFDAHDILEREMLAALSFAKTQAGIAMLLAQPEQWRQGRPNPHDRTLWRLLHPSRVAIVGVPNVGKSTLANQLFGQQRSITADMPGTTRDWVGELADIDGVAIVLLDTPGVRESNDAIEQAAIDLSRDVVKSADLVIAVLDPTQPMEPQRALCSGKTVNVLNKSDLVEGDFDAHIRTVATTGIGIDLLRRYILGHLGVFDIDRIRPLCWTDRQLDHLAGSSTSY